MTTKTGVKRYITDSPGFDQHTYGTGAENKKR